VSDSHPPQLYPSPLVRLPGRKSSRYRTLALWLPVFDYQEAKSSPLWACTCLIILARDQRRCSDTPPRLAWPRRLRRVARHRGRWALHIAAHSSLATDSLVPTTARLHSADVGGAQAPGAAVGSDPRRADHRVQQAQRHRARRRRGYVRRRSCRRVTAFIHSGWVVCDSTFSPPRVWRRRGALARPGHRGLDRKGDHGDSIELLCGHGHFA
jgi:hypothetical protein